MSTMSAYEQEQRRGQAFARFCISGPREPWEPLATRAEVLEVACRACGAGADAECAVDSRCPSFLGATFLALRGIHTRRYLDRTHDPR